MKVIRLLLSGLLLFSGGVVGGAISQNPGLDVIASGDKTITADKIVINDPSGRPAIVLSAETQGRPEIFFGDADSRRLMHISLSEKGPLLIMKNQNQGSALSADEMVYYQGEQALVHLKVEQDESARLIFTENGKTRTAIGVTPKRNTTGISLFDKSGAARAYLYMDEKDEPVIAFRTDENKIKWMAP